MSVSQQASPFRSTNRENHHAIKKRYSGCGLSGARHKRTEKSAILGVSKPNIRRLARKAGVKRIGLDTYDEAKIALTTFLSTMLKDIGVITEGARRMTVTVPDVLLALKRNGRTLYGFGEINSLDQYATCIRKPIKQDVLQRAAARLQRCRPRQMPSSPQMSQARSQAALSPASPNLPFHEETRHPDGDSQQEPAQSMSGMSGGMDLIPATPTTPSQPTTMPLSEEMREHIQDGVGEYVSKVYQYDPPGSVYKVKDLHSWVACQYFQRKGLECCSPEQLQTVLYALDEEGQVMISNDDNDLQIRFVM